jgi:hypothetical protein
MATIDEDDAGGVTDADPSDPAPADAQADGQGDTEGDKQARKKSARPAHKGTSRKPAARARRPAKPKTPEGA